MAARNSWTRKDYEEMMMYGDRVAYKAKIAHPKQIAHINSDWSIGEWRPYDGEYLADHLAHNIPGCWDAAMAGIEIRFHKDQTFVAVK